MCPARRPSDDVGGPFLFFVLTISLSLRFGPALCPVAEEALGRQVSEHRRDGSATIQAPRRRRRAPRVQRRSAGSPDACVTSCSCLPGEPTPSSLWAHRTSISHRPCGAGIDRRSHTCSSRGRDRRTSTLHRQPLQNGLCPDPLVLP